MQVSHSFDNGAVFTFTGKPSAAVRGMLKANGFRWSPSAGHWWRRGVVGAADLLAAIRLQLDRESGIRRPDGDCWDCKSAPGFFRNYGAATPVRCDDCERKHREAAAARNRPDYSDIAYEDACARACGF